MEDNIYIMWINFGSKPNYILFNLRYRVELKTKLILTADTLGKSIIIDERNEGVDYVKRSKWE